jgi:hypothetical protein
MFIVKDGVEWKAKEAVLTSLVQYSEMFTNSSNNDKSTRPG